MPWPLAWPCCLPCGRCGLCWEFCGRYTATTFFLGASPWAAGLDDVCPAAVSAGLDPPCAGVISACLGAPWADAVSVCLGAPWADAVSADLDDPSARLTILTCSSLTLEEWVLTS